MSRSKSFSSYDLAGEEQRNLICISETWLGEYKRSNCKDLPRSFSGPSLATAPENKEHVNKTIGNHKYLIQTWRNDEVCAITSWPNPWPFVFASRYKYVSHVAWTLRHILFILFSYTCGRHVLVICNYIQSIYACKVYG